MLIKFSFSSDDVQGVATPEAAKGKRKAKKAMPGHHQCHECGNVYKFRSSLLHHEKCQHGARGGKTFQCVECQLKFIRKRDLERHENVVHTKVKPHTCQTCLKTFADKKNLTKSRHACQPNEPFPCSHCGKTFPLRKYLADHMRYTHCDASSRSCACKHCFTSFKHREQLRRHSVKCVSNAEKDLCA